MTSKQFQFAASRNFGGARAVAGSVLGASALVLMVGALPGYAIHSDGEPDLDPDDADLDGDLPEELAGAEHSDDLDGLEEGKLYEYSYQSELDDGPDDGAESDELAESDEVVDSQEEGADQEQVEATDPDSVDSNAEDDDDAVVGLLDAETDTDEEAFDADAEQSEERN